MNLGSGKAKVTDALAGVNSAIICRTAAASGRPAMTVTVGRLSNLPSTPRPTATTH